MKINTIKFIIIMSMIALIAFFGYGIMYGDLKTNVSDTVKVIIIALTPILGMAIANLFRKPGG